MDPADADDGGLAPPPSTAPPPAVRAAIKAKVLSRSLGQAVDTPKVAGRYRLLKEIGRGGMGTVWEAELDGESRRVALKLLRSSRSDQQAARRLLREAVSVSQIGHPNIVRVIDVGTDAEGAPYLAMDLLGGESLASLSARRGGLPWAEVQEIALPLCNALQAAHDAGVVHRDLKPANVLVERRNGRTWHPTVLDFGLCSTAHADVVLTEQGALLGTPGYMAPEQIRGKPVDGRADLYALACIVVELVAGAPAFGPGRRSEVLASQLAGDLPELRKTIPTRARAALLHALSVSADDRPRSASELARALGSGGTTPAPGKDRAPNRGATVPAPGREYGGAVGSFEPVASRSGARRIGAPRRGRILIAGAVTVAAFALGILLVQQSRSKATPSGAKGETGMKAAKTPAQRQED